MSLLGLSHNPSCSCLNMSHTSSLFLIHCSTLSNFHLQLSQMYNPILSKIENLILLVERNSEDGRLVNFKTFGIKQMIGNRFMSYSRIFVFSIGWKIKRQLRRKKRRNEKQNRNKNKNKNKMKSPLPNSTLTDSRLLKFQRKSNRYEWSWQNRLVNIW